jgi:hypothetical protein
MKEWRVHLKLSLRSCTNWGDLFSAGQQLTLLLTGRILICRTVTVKNRRAMNSTRFRWQATP